MSDKKDKKTTIKVDKETHKKLRLKAAKEDKKMQEVVEEVIKKGLSE